MPIDVNKVGQDGSVKTPEEQYDSQHGRYKDPVEDLPAERRLPMKQFPQGPDPDPFNIGGLGSG